MAVYHHRITFDSIAYISINIHSHSSKYKSLKIHIGFHCQSDLSAGYKIYLIALPC